MAFRKYPKVKRFIGDGASKLCFALSKSKVALIADPVTLRHELRMLALLNG